MTREKEIEQLCAELAQLRTEDGAWDERCLYEFIKERDELRAELAQAQVDKELAQQGHLIASQEVVDLRAELAQAQTECNVLAKTFTDANELHAIVRGELAQAQRRLAIPDQICGYCGYRYSAGTNEANFAVLAEHIESCPKHPLAKALVELAQARAELAREHQVAKATMVELKRADRSAHVEAEGLRRQLKHAEDAHTYRFKEYDALEIDLCHAAASEAAIVEAAQALLKQPYIFVGNPAESTMEIVAASKKLQAALEHRSEAAAKLLERLAEAEQQWAWWVGEMQDSEERHTQTRVKLARADKRLAAVEQRAERAETMAASTREAVEWLWGFWDGNTLVAKPGYEDDIREAWDRLLAATDGEATVNLLGRLEEAEALAALVTEETAALLERLAVIVLDNSSDIHFVVKARYARNAKAACALAAQIREALDDSQA